MKTIYLIRHAKSDWSSGVSSDFHRPLNARGMSDAPMMGKRLLDKQIIPDKIFSSTAERAAQTTKLICKEINYPLADIEWVPHLYHVSENDLLKFINNIPDNNLNTIFVVSHNPGITAFANMVIDNFVIDNMPTCCILGMQNEQIQWASIEPKSNTFLYLDYPKKTI